MLRPAIHSVDQVQGCGQSTTSVQDSIKGPVDEHLVASQKSPRYAEVTYRWYHTLNLFRDHARSKPRPCISSWHQAQCRFGYRSLSISSCNQTLPYTGREDFLTDTLRSVTFARRTGRPNISRKRGLHRQGQLRPTMWICTGLVTYNRRQSPRMLPISEIVANGEPLECLNQARSQTQGEYIWQ
jgi:hypothetical protein